MMSLSERLWTSLPSRCCWMTSCLMSSCMHEEEISLLAWLKRQEANA